jgi:hypothetical protein
MRIGCRREVREPDDGPDRALPVRDEDRGSPGVRSPETQANSLGIGVVLGIPNT